MNPQAEALNAVLLEQSPIVHNLLSARGKAAFFPAKGIMGQTADAKGKTYNATIGIALEDDGTPMRLPAIHNELKLAPKDVYPYAPSYGKPELRQRWQQMIQEKNPALSTEISLPVVSAALTHGLTTVVNMWLDPGEQIILPDMFWGNYKLMFQQAYDVEFETYTTFTDDGLDLESFRQAVGGNTAAKKVVLLNFPNNPTGYSPTVEEAQAIVQTLTDRAEAGDQLLVILDDAYFGLTYEDHLEKQSLFAYLADAHENLLAVKVDGPTKEDYVWGFRVGFVTYGGKGLTPAVYKVLEDKTAGLIRGSVSNVSHLGQSLLLQAYDDPTYAEQKQAKYDLLKSRYQAVQRVLQNPDFATVFTPLPFNAGYFMCVQLVDGLDGEAVRQRLLEHYDTGIIAVGNLLRIAFSCVSEPDLETLFTNIYQACRDCSA